LNAPRAGGTIALQPTGPAMSNTFPNAPTREETARNYAVIVHACYAAALLVGVTSIVGVVIAYIKRPDVAGTIYESHLHYAIRTFWIGLAMGLAGFVLTFVIIGIFVLIFTGVWYIIRVVRAFLAWADQKPIDNPRRFF
jgi:uncharacterized membrane protein